MPHIAAERPRRNSYRPARQGRRRQVLVALHLAQYFADRGLPTAVFDSDRGNANAGALPGAAGALHQLHAGRCILT